MEKKMAYLILETEKDDRGYIPCLVQEGDRGYYTTDWRWGHDINIAKRIAKERNEAMGLTPLDTAKIILQSLRQAS